MLTEKQWTKAKEDARNGGKKLGESRRKSMDNSTDDLPEFNFGEWADESTNDIMPYCVDKWETLEPEEQDELIDAWFDGYYSA